MRPTILIVPRLSERLIKRMSERYEVLGPVDRSDPDLLPPGAERARALVTFGGFRTDAGLMAAMPALGLINLYGTGYEGVDQVAARERGILIANAGDTNATSVAEFAMALVLAGCRLIPAADRYVRAGLWTSRAVDQLPNVPGLAGRRLGIYGLGAIGQRVATRAAAFEMEIGYHGRLPRPSVPYVYHSTLAGLAEWSDVLVVAVRAGEENHHAVNAAVLKALGSDGYLVNISRGSTVDEAALCDAIEAGQLAGAGLDVFESEPGVSDRLRALDQLILTPHVAAKTRSAQHAQEDLLMDNLGAFFAGQPLISPV